MISLVCTWRNGWVNNGMSVIWDAIMLIMTSGNANGTTLWLAASWHQAICWNTSDLPSLGLLKTHLNEILTKKKYSSMYIPSAEWWPFCQELFYICQGLSPFYKTLMAGSMFPSLKSKLPWADMKHQVRQIYGWLCWFSSRPSDNLGFEILLAPGTSLLPRAIRSMKQLSLLFRN